MRLIGISPLNAGGIGLAQILETENPRGVQIRENPDMAKLNCGRIVLLGSLSGEDTYHALAEISISGAKALPESLDHLSLNANSLKFLTTRQAA